MEMMYNFERNRDEAPSCRASKMSAVKRPKALIKAKQCKNNTASSSKQGVRLGRLSKTFKQMTKIPHSLQRRTPHSA